MLHYFLFYFQLEQAKEVKDRANEIFKANGDMTEAVRLYKQAIDLCPPDEKVEKAIQETESSSEEKVLHPIEDGKWSQSPRNLLQNPPTL